MAGLVWCQLNGAIDFRMSTSLQTTFKIEGMMDLPKWANLILVFLIVEGVSTLKIWVRYIEITLCKLG
jgi:hypothetical protein